MDDSVYADDTGALFCSREECEKGIPPLINLIERFGGEVHVKKAGQQKESKSVVLFVANQASEYDRHSAEEGGAATFGGADLSDIAVGGGSTVAVVKQAKYLGSWMDTSGGDEVDVEKRIAAAAQAFGALRKCVFKNSAITKRVKAVVYMVLVLTVLLYGCEAWALTTRLWQRLRSFHERCVRVIAGVNMWHVEAYRITSAEYLERAGINCIETYVHRRQLRWIGHVSRMPWDRLPGRFLSSWCYQARPVGRPVYRWGEGAEGAIKAVELKVKDWAAFAAERVDWRALVHGYDDPDVTPGSIKSSRSSSKSKRTKNKSNNKRTALTRVKVIVTALLDWRIAPSYLEIGVELSEHSREIQRLYAIWEAHKESEEAAAAIAAAAITAAAATAAATTPAPTPESEPEPELEPAPTARVPLTAAQKAACFATLAQTITTKKSRNSSTRSSVGSNVGSFGCLGAVVCTRQSACK